MMKKMLRALLLALPLLAAAPAEAHAWGFWCALWGGNCCNDGYGYGCCSGVGCGCGPWYTSWPAHAPAGPPAYPEFPYWPAQMGPSIYTPPPPGPAAPRFMPGVQQSAYNYGYYQQPPAYWYGR